MGQGYLCALRCGVPASVERSIKPIDTPARVLNWPSAGMKRSLIIPSALALALVALIPSPSASAAEITYVSVDGIWHDPVDNVPGSQPGDPVITNGSPTSIIRWG
ncbi:MAG TPA: hypothetical protein VLD39_02025, partial [Gammaproteobacteria bacterium]|nr:hypothetical protein [Gammaproteobacteria bacterium]